MKNMIILLLLITSISAANSQTQPFNDINRDNNPAEYTISKKNPDLNSNLTLIEFSPGSGNFVRVYVNNSEGETIEILAEGEIENESKGVYFRPAEELQNGIYTCKMDIYSSDRKNIVYSTEVIINNNTDLVKLIKK